jgi:hypothetical protein
MIHENLARITGFSWMIAYMGVGEKIRQGGD